MHMFDSSKTLYINEDRFRKDFEILAKIGSTEDGGVHRPALSKSHLEARAWYRDLILESELEFRCDGAGNRSAFLACGPKNAPTLLLGSHLDSVPYGGRFDGPLGVLAALETLRVVKENGISLPVNLEAIDFTDEEGSLIGLTGSYALAGKLTKEDLDNPRGGRQALLEGMKRAGLDDASFLSARRIPKSLAGYLELHIEQGPRLLKKPTQIGIVTTIVGICSYHLRFIGRANHAGTTPMLDRLDASQGASSFILQVRQTILEKFPECVANVGNIHLSPGAFNIVPERADIALEFRSAEPQTFSILEKTLIGKARAAAKQFRLGLESDLLSKHSPTPLSSQAQNAIEQAADALGLNHIHLVSGAGHDAQALADLCPAGMIFVPSQLGISHSPKEFTHWEDCVNGANVLVGATLRMANTIITE